MRAYTLYGHKSVMLSLRKLANLSYRDSLNVKLNIFFNEKPYKTRVNVMDAFEAFTEVDQIFLYDNEILLAETVFITFEICSEVMDGIRIIRKLIENCLS